MAGKRAPVVLALVAILAVGLLLFFLFGQEGDRAGRRGTADGRGTESDVIPGTGSSASDKAVYEARLKEILEKYGARNGTGAVYLTKPKAPGVGLKVTVRAQIDGFQLEAEAFADKAGGFSFASLPGVDGYSLEIAGDRAQPYRRTGIALSGGSDLGTHDVDRWYFVKGRVVGQGASGVKGAKVALVTPSGSGGRFNFLDLALNMKEPDPAIAETQTAGQGRFEFRLETPGTYGLRVRAEGWATHYRSPVVVGGGGIEDLVVALTAGHEVTGYVLDGAGRPAADIPVAVIKVSFRDWSWPKEIAVTDGSGRFTFQLEPSSQEYYLNVVPPDAAIVTQRFRVPLEEELVVRLPANAVLVGRIVDSETEQPIAGADILVGVSQNVQMWGMPDVSRALRTDDYGRYRVEGVTTGQIQSIAIRAEGYAYFSANAMAPTDPQVAAALRKVRIAANGETKLPDIPLKKGIVLRGKVTDSISKDPIEGVTIEISDWSLGTRWTKTEADGTYRFPNMGDRAAMVVRAHGYADFRDNFRGVALQADNGTAERDFELTPGAVLEGSVLDKQKRPIANAYVRLRPRQTGWSNWQQAASLRDVWTHTDQAGGYRLEGVPGFKLYIETEAPGFDRGESQGTLELKPGESKTVDVVMLPAAKIGGAVVTGDDIPIQSARITVAKDPGRDADTRAQWMALADGMIGFSGVDGSFLIENVPVGNILVRVEVNKYATLTKRYGGVEPGKELLKERLILAPAKKISGRIVDENGKPFSRCWLRAKQTASPDGEPQSQLLGARVKQDGTFEVENLPDGVYTIEVRVSNRMPGMPNYQNLTRPNVTAGTEGLRLTLTLEPEPQPSDG